MRFQTKYDKKVDSFIASNYKLSYYLGYSLMSIIAIWNFKFNMQYIYGYISAILISVVVKWMISPDLKKVKNGRKYN